MYVLALFTVEGDELAHVIGPFEDFYTAYNHVTDNYANSMYTYMITKLDKPDA